MDKQRFLAELRGALSGLPRVDVEERLAFYGEMIDARMEEGLSEAEAVARTGPVSRIVSQTVADIPLSTLVRDRFLPERERGEKRARSEGSESQGRRRSGATIALLALGFPLWLPLLVAAFSVLLSLYITVWAVIVSLWAAGVGLWAGGLGGLAGGAFFACMGHGWQGLVLCGAGLVCAGLAIFWHFGCAALTRGAAVGTKMLFVRRRRAK